MQVLYDDENWLVVHKPIGIATHGAHLGDLGVQEWIQLQMGVQTFVCSRLDKETSGILLLAKTPRASARAQAIHENNTSLKEYLLLVTATQAQSLPKDEFCVDLDIDQKSATTSFFKMDKIGQYQLYKAQISRGRMHQIRRHAAHAGIPIVGDKLYGGTEFSRLCLHCYTLRWPEISCVITSQVPEVFKKTNEASTEALVSTDRRLHGFAAITNAFRLIQRGELSYLDCQIDKYAEGLMVWVFDAAAEFEKVKVKFLEDLKYFQRIYAVSGLIIKLVAKDPHNKGLIGAQEIHGVLTDTSKVFERDCHFYVSLVRDQHAGLFLDQRDNRARVQSLSRGKRVANLFAYTCSFSVAAAKGGCNVVFSVDTSRAALDAGKLNFKLNSIPEGQGKFIHEDVRSWLLRQERKVQREGDQARFDIIICDPPTFSSTKQKGFFSVDQEWEWLARMCKNILHKDGCVFMSNNHRTGNKAEYEKILKSIFAHVHILNLPFDFPILSKMPSSTQLFFCQ